MRTSTLIGFLGLGAWLVACGGGTSPYGNAGAAGTSCSPSTQIEGCYEQLRMMCNSQTSTWVVIEACTSPKVCSESPGSIAGTYVSECVLPGGSPTDTQPAVDTTPPPTDTPTESCTPPYTTSCETVCGSVGSKDCTVQGQWGECRPPDESCDGVDNNCDGVVDENLVETCETACGTGSKTCTNGVWGECVGVAPVAEVCDGFDNDCDGATDENEAGEPLTQSCQEACGEGGVQSCSNGVWGACSIGPEEEVCDGKDNDCDGETDETCACQPNEAQACGTDLGICSPGIQVCDESGNWGPCGGDAFKGPEPEVCDGLDNDCDGVVDCDGLTIPMCQTKMAGIGAACGTANKDEGGAPDISLPCKKGVETCVDGAISCVGGVSVAAEICDGVDNDCDGQIDEGTLVDTTEPNDTCETRYDLGEVGKEAMVLKTHNIDSPDDVDWFEVTVKDEANIGLGESFKLTVTLSDIPEGQDYELCVWPSNKDVKFTNMWEDDAEQKAKTCDDLADDGICADLAIWVDGSGPETYKATWSGLPISNDSRTFLIKVVPFNGSGEICSEPYTLTLSQE